jgi:hypothetical protein
MIRHKFPNSGRQYQAVVKKILTYCFFYYICTVKADGILCIVIRKTSDSVRTLRWAANGHIGQCPNPSLGSGRRLWTMSKPFVGQPTDTSDNVQTLRWAANGHLGQCPNTPLGSQRTVRTKCEDFLLYKKKKLNKII